MARVFDTRGRYLGDTPEDNAPGVGAYLWEFLHPFQVQDEYAAVGKSPPPVSEIMSEAASGIESQAVTGLSTGLDNLQTAAKIGLVLGAIFVAAYAYRSFTR